MGGALIGRRKKKKNLVMRWKERALALGAAHLVMESLVLRRGHLSFESMEWTQCSSSMELDLHHGSSMELGYVAIYFRCSGGSVVLLDRTVHRPWHFRGNSFCTLDRYLLPLYHVTNTASLVFSASLSTSSAGQPCSSLPDGSLFCIPRNLIAAESMLDELSGSEQQFH
ncbi:hypothetical protein LOK49_Contig429G00001 [Camellia lanceoleosa]|nr:hypothetical protein LOK49_Contig429G00001 [Camellia lanceoleosa]